MKRSFLDVAVTVLDGRRNPMSVGEIVDEARRRRLLKTKGKTPEATLTAALNRHIEANGKESVVVKPAPGRFIRRRKSRR